MPRHRCLAPTQEYVADTFGLGVARNSVGASGAIDVNQRREFVAIRFGGLPIVTGKVNRANRLIARTTWLGKRLGYQGERATPVRGAPRKRPRRHGSLGRVC